MLMIACPPSLIWTCSTPTVCDSRALSGTLEKVCHLRTQGT
jgi:hypothetical protein